MNNNPSNALHWCFVRVRIELRKRLTPAELRKTMRISCSVIGWLVASGFALEAGVRMELI